MDIEKVFWVMLAAYGVTMLLDGSVQVATEGTRLVDWGTVICALLVLVGGFSGFRRSGVSPRISRPLCYLGIFGALLAIASVISRYFF